MWLFEPIPTCLSESHLGGLFSCSALLKMGVDVVCRIGKIHINLQSPSLWRSTTRWRLLLIASPWAFGGWYGLLFYAIALYISVGFKALCKHGRFHLNDKHSAFPSTTRDDLAFLLDEPTTLVKSNLHALLNNLANRDQIRRYGQYMQDVSDASLFAFFPEWDIANMLNRMCGVISGLNIAESIWRPT